MLFTSLEFLVLFLPAVLGVALLLRGSKLLWWIAAASCTFYGFAGHAWFLLPMAVTTTLDYVVAHQLVRRKSRAARRALLWSSLTTNLGLLAYFKYSHLILGSLQDALSLLGISGSVLDTGIHVVLPAGISFYTFQTMSYLIDVYRGDAEPEHDFIKYLTFVAFFPHLVAGPLTRHNQLLPQLTKLAAVGITPAWRDGIVMFSLGLLKKIVLADRIGNLVDPVIANLGEAGAVEAWLAIIGYSMQLYFDFSGYSDMAVGLGRLFNVELPQNFDSPYKARDPSDFWRRWHISLSQWLRDYLYISLGGNRLSEARRLINLMITMFLGGLWHGASWSFAIWGSYHGLLLILHRRHRARWERLSVPWRRALMFLMVCVGWVFFRSENLSVAMTWFEAMAGGHGWLMNALPGAELFQLSGLVVGATGLAMFAKNSFELDFSKLTGPRLVALGCAAGVAVLLMNFSSKFLYYQF